MRKLLLIILFPFLLAPCWTVIADTAGPSPAGTGANDNGVGTVDWTDTSNITTSDNARATVALSSNQISHYLTATGFGFSIPAGSIIQGIQAELELGADNTFGDGEHSIKIIKGGTVQGTDKSTNGSWGGIGGADQITTYGGASDLWGVSWTASDINASDFGVAAACDTNGVGASREGRIDRVRITVTFVVPSLPRRMIVMSHFGPLPSRQMRVVSL
jgi:hypothetical protein